MNQVVHASHFTEEALIEYRLGEDLVSAEHAAIRRHLESCAQCAALSESIAETLRVFSAGPVPVANLDHQWQRLRGNLSVLGGSARRGRAASWMWWPVAGMVAAAIALVVFVMAVPHRTVFRTGAVASIHRPGPLSATPADPDIALQLDNAERLLTEVNHTSGALDESTRAQAHELLLKNAVYVRSAKEQGDLGTASVLEDLGRVLTNIDHVPESDDNGWHLRLEWNTKGLLLDIRILRQNDQKQ